MTRIVSIILIGLLLCPCYYSQQKTFGHRISGSGGVISDVFNIQNGFVLDSAVERTATYRFEYNEKGKLIRDINLITRRIKVIIDGKIQYKQVPAYRDYYYNDIGAVDSIIVRCRNDNGWMDSLSYNIYYTYDINGKLLSKKSSNTTNIDEYNYDSLGNLISINTIVGGDTISDVREYDSQNRLTLTERVINGKVDGEQYIYKYDSNGDINCLCRMVYPNKISNESNFYIKFDEFGKATYEIDSHSFLSDSTWGKKYEIVFEYDDNGRILKMGPCNWFHYNTDGNLDSTVILHITQSGFLATKATFIDSYGNNIVLPNYSIMTFYYSKVVTDIKQDDLRDETFALFPNYPNPFNPTTTIKYNIPKQSHVTLKIYDVLGREVTTLVNEKKQSGTYSATWNAQDIPSGVYFYRITADKYSKTNKMILLK